MDDFKRIPRRPEQQPAVPPQPLPPRGDSIRPEFQSQTQVSSQSQPQTQPRLEDAPLPEDMNLAAPEPKKKNRKKRAIFAVLASLFVLAVAALGTTVWWYQSQLSPVNSGDETKKMITIESGSTPTAIASQLTEEGLIRNETAFLWYTRIEGVQNALQAGSYRLSASESTQEIVEHLTNGNVDTFSITFIPGTTVKQQKEVFTNAGYSQQEVDAAFAKTYDSPLFEGRPAGADLEGYVYPETYTFGSDTSVEAILQHTFDQFYAVIQENNLVAGYREQGLSLFEGIVMASIIQKEAVGGDERQISQVFIERYSIGMELGSDPTYQYITDKLGVPRDLNFDSPYNTRRFAGIPPGPIANPGLTVLKAVADPAEGDFLYFFSGDDDVTYYSNTLAEHERKVAELCKVKCSFL